MQYEIVSSLTIYIHQKAETFIVQSESTKNLHTGVTELS